MMTILLLGGYNSTYLYDWLKSKGYEVILQDRPLDMGFVRQKTPDWIISYNYRWIIKEDIIDFMENKIINLHISYLPWNKGAHPNLWSIIDGTPSGVSIHMIDKGIDTGPIIARKKVLFSEEETLRTSYIFLQSEVIKLFKSVWNLLLSGDYILTEQSQLNEKGSFHSKDDLHKVRHLLEPLMWDTKIKTLKFRFKNDNR